MALVQFSKLLLRLFGEQGYEEGFELLSYWNQPPQDIFRSKLQRLPMAGFWILGGNLNTETFVICPINPAICSDA